MAMASVEKPLVYLVLGAAGSGRREVLHDLIKNGLDDADHPVVLLSAVEADATDEAASLPEVVRWDAADGFVAAELPDEASHIFFVGDGYASPADQVEAFQGWLAASGGELARVICVVNCQLAEKNPALAAWYDACVHFADVVFLNRREGVANKWLSDFQARYRDLFYPALFEMLKGGHVKNPALILTPEARRMTHVFDEDQEWIVTGEDGETIEDWEEGGGEEDEVSVEAEQDPYLERLLGGRRVKELPDIATFLPARD